ncbi:MAG: hypothetical protein ABI162_20005 [Luteolibacter sp.]
MLSPETRNNHILHLTLLIAVTVIVGLAAITNQSLWMDEGSSAFKALMPTFKDWWFMTRRIGGSDIQMPVYMFLLWAWEKLGAHSEYALRAINIPWLVIAVLALKRVRFWPLICLTSPFVLYYVGELRPYTMQIAGGALAAAAIFKVAAGRDKNDLHGLHATAAASLLLAASSLTAAVWSLGLWVGVFIIRPDWLRNGRFWIRISPWICAAAIIGSYYVYTLLKGYRASGNDTGGVMSTFFGFYEMIGLLGLGPGRNELRISPKALISSLPILVPALACIFIAWLGGLRGWIRTTPRSIVFGTLCAVILPILILVIVGQVMDFRVLGRHLSPAIPAVLLPIAAAFETAEPKKPLVRIVACIALLFSLISCLGLRFLERHSRDDYRRATEIAVEALKQDKKILWQADMNATRYYAYRAGGTRLVNSVQILETDAPSSLMFADLVVVNRPDLRYKQGDYQAELRRNSFELSARFTGFEIWKSR